MTTKVVPIGLRPSQRKTLEVVDELRELAAAGKLSGFAYVAEIECDRTPIFGVLGVYYAEPYRALAACTRLWTKLTRIADWREQFRA